MITRGLAGACVSLLIFMSTAVPAQVISGVDLGAHSSSHTTLTKRGHIGLIGCAANLVTIRVTMARLVYAESQPVTVVAVLRNAGISNCQYVAPAGAEPLWLGLCGLSSLTVKNPKGVLVFPEKGVVNCPALVSRVLTPGASLRASGSWDQRKSYPSRGFVPRGKYRLTVGNVVTFSVTLR